MQTKTNLTVNFERLQRDIDVLSEIGREEDGGIYRMAFTRADMEARAWLQDRLKEAGLETELDGAANVWGYLDSSMRGPAVIMGSHLDSVPSAGHLDGALGVLVALECLRRLKEENIKPDFPVQIVGFSDEEGRFGGMLGSQALVGDLTPEKINNAADLDGVTLEEAMQSHGLSIRDVLSARRPPESVRAFLELHIEQGPVLDRMGFQAGIVEQIVGLIKWSIRLIGATDHAGTTPMNMRRDALGGLVEFAGEIPRILEEQGSEDSVATVGSVSLFPGTANSVPGQVEFSLDCRDPSTDVLKKLGEAFRTTLSAIGRRRDLMFEFDVLSEITPVYCDKNIVDLIETKSEALNIRSHRMPSGAAHDTQIMAEMAPVGMIFVPSKDGRSHSSAEWSHLEDIETCSNLALETLAALASNNFQPGER